MRNYRSLCPVARCLDIFGDRWTLLVLREVAVFGRTTFKELAAMPEKIATNTLSDRLDKLTVAGLLTKTQSDKNRLVYHYHATQKGMDLLPIVQEFAKWAEKYLYEENEAEQLKALMATVKMN